MKPQILIEFPTSNSVTWRSVGWSNDKKLMAKAKTAINQGNTPTEVIENLTTAGFDVAEIFTKGTEH